MASDVIITVCENFGLGLSAQCLADLALRVKSLLTTLDMFWCLANIRSLQQQHTSNGQVRHQANCIEFTHKVCNNETE